MEKVTVNPRKDKDGNAMKAFDSIGRIIPFRKNGNTVRKTTVISRQIKFGDLVIIEKVKKEKPKVITESNKKNSEV